MIIRRVFNLRVMAVAALLGLAGAHGVAQVGPANAGQGGGQQRAAARSGPVGIPAAVTAAIAQRGRARIIIGLGVPFAPEGRLAARDAAQQRADVAGMQDAVLAALAGLDVDDVKRFHVIPAMGANVGAAALQALARMPGVAYIEEDGLSYSTLAESTVIVGAPAAWSTGFTGAGQTVAILDTGVEKTHPFFGGRVVSEACYSTTSAEDDSTSVCPGGVPATTAPGSGVPCAVGNCGHGTHVAGIAAGNGTTFDGVARDASIIAVQVFSLFAGSSIASFHSDQVAGMERIYDLRGTFNIAAVNLSLGGDQYSDQATCDADNASRKAIIDTLRSVGIATVISSGNGGSVDSLSAPGCISSAISVGSTTDGSFGLPVDEVSEFSNAASFLNLLAPGEFINSSVPVGTGPNGTDFSNFAGTSMAAPHVTGTWALLRSRYSQATVDQILAALHSTGTNILDPGNGLTFKRINVNLALNALGANCTFSLSQSSASIPPAGSPGAFDVVTQSGCQWSAASNAPWIAITSATSGLGPQQLTFNVGQNFNGPRRGTLTVAGRTFTINQAESTGTWFLDLNSDRKLDLLWHHQTNGQIAGWLMNGTQLIDGTLLNPSQVPDTTWKVVGAGDLDGDDQIDLVWQNVADGRISAWLMNGLTLREGSLFNIPQVPDLQWKIRGVGDLNGDGRADLFWQHEGTGQLAVWLMNGLNVIDGMLLSPSSIADLQWKLVGTGDFDRNGSRDLVFHHQGDGRIGLWFMNGTTQISGSLTSPAAVPDLNWKIRAVGDLDGDGNQDFLWQNISTGQISVWLMNGLTLIDGTLLSTPVVADTNWHVVGPR